MSRILAREYCFKLAFEYQFLLQQDNDFVDEIFEDEKLTDEDKQFIKSTSEGIANHCQEIDQMIAKFLKGYTLERLFKIDLAILRVAVYELKFAEEKLAESIIVDSAVELSKKYSTDNSYKFINGILANIIRGENDSKTGN